MKDANSFINSKNSPCMSTPLEYKWADSANTLANDEYWRVNEAVLRQAFNSLYSELVIMQGEIDELKKRVRNV